MSKQVFDIEGKQVYVIDDFYSKEICNAWVKYYMNDIRFVNGTSEDFSRFHKTFVFYAPLDLGIMQTVFDMAQNFMPLIKEYNKLNNTSLKFTDMYRAHLNLMMKDNTFKGHVDGPDDGLVFLWFANPFFKDNVGGGMYVGNESFCVENKFNRMLVFPRNIWHKTEPVTDKDAIRLTVYTGFKEFDKDEIRNREFSVHMPNMFCKLVEDSEQTYYDLIRKFDVDPDSIQILKEDRHG